MLPFTSITETSLSLLITAVAVHGSLVILNKHPSLVTITFVLCNDFDRAAAKSLANFTAAANFYLLMTAPMTGVFAFSPVSSRTSLSGKMANSFYV